MRVVFDLSPAQFTPGGTRSYAENLSRALRGLAPGEGVAFAVSPLPAWMEPRGRKGLRHKFKVAAWDSYYMHLLLPHRARAAAAELIHTPAFRLPLRAPVPVVTTIFDATARLFPELFRLHDRLTINAYIRYAARYAAQIITISEQSRHDIQRLFHIDAARIHVTYPGISSRFEPAGQAQVADALARLGVAGPYLLSVGTIEPRKNLPRLMEAFARLKTRRGIPHRLVLVGKYGWLQQKIFELARGLGVADAITFTGFVPEANLPALYSGATAFVYPSLYEGFGIPPMEAMACACPVVTSKISSLPEVVGDAALLVDPYSVDELADAIARVIADRHLADQLRAQGLLRAQRFSWETCARQTLAVYRLALR